MQLSLDALRDARHSLWTGTAVGDSGVAFDRNDAPVIADELQPLHVEELRPASPDRRLVWTVDGDRATAVWQHAAAAGWQSRREIVFERAAGS